MQQVNIEAILPHLWVSGRSSRAEWWRVHIFCAVVVTVFDHMFIARLEQGLEGMSDAPVTILWLAVTAVLGWVSFCSMVRRLHDRGKSGWWAILYLVPGIGWLWLLIECGFLPSRDAAVAAAAPKPMPAPAFTRPVTPQSAPQATTRQAPAPQRRSQLDRPPPRRATRAPVSAAPRVGTIQRIESRPWTLERALKVAGGTIGVMLVAVVLYKWFLDPNANLGQIIISPVKINENLPVFEKP